MYGVLSYYKCKFKSVRWGIFIIPQFSTIKQDSFVLVCRLSMCYAI